MKASLWFSSLIGALLLLGTGPSRAVVVTVTYTGTVNHSNDGPGIFGPLDGNVDGQSFVLTQVFDTSLGPNTVFSTAAIASSIYGGTAHGNVSPSLGATLTIGATSATWSGAYFGSIAAYNDGSLSQQVHGTTDANLGYVEAHVANYAAVLPPSVTTPFTYIVGPADDANGYYKIFDPGFGGYSYGYLTIDNLTVSTGAVPLPAALPLFASGLGLLGIAGWRKRRKAAA